ncbi:hypothetical protein RND81_13G124900 [Saponaria officinalis]|uniref:Uncharacterized protein n=1 Tax=Saponaria officinalis TaxID=3572 RepID=A0AAW1H083_SAPOF
MPHLVAKLWWVLLANIIVLGKLAISGRLECDFPAIYNFGDSNSDTGGISAAFLPLPWPNGQNFLKKPSGRYSDDRLILDLIDIGGIYVAYQSLSWPNGETSFKNSFGRYSDGRLIVDFFGNPMIRSMLPKEEVFSKALYTFDIGQNDLGVAFRTMNNDDQIRADIPNIIDQFSSAVQNLYKKGARFFWIHNTGPIGCIPDSTGSITPQPGTLDQYGCIKSQNDIANEFNKQLSDAVLKLGTELPKAALTYVDVYTAKYGLISQAANLGWEDPTKLCCGYLEKDGRVWCGRKGLVNNGSVVYGGACSQPERYVSWDGIHYTEAANHWFANLIINGSLSDPPNPITYACYRD